MAMVVTGDSDDKHKTLVFLKGFVVALCTVFYPNRRVSTVHHVHSTILVYLGVILHLT